MIGETLKRILAVLLIAGTWGAFVYAQTGANIVPRNPADPSIHEGSSGDRSAGVKTNVNPQVGQSPASYVPFRSLYGAIGSLVQPYSVQAPTPANPDSVGFKYQFSQVFPFLYSQTLRIDRLFAGTKGIGGKNVTDVARLGTPGGKNPGDPYWVAYPRVGNVENPPGSQIFHHQFDCFCRWDEMVNCPLSTSPFFHVNFGAEEVPPHFTPVKCQVCFGVERIRKHDFYVGESKTVAFDGYPYSDPKNPGYQECLRQSIQSYSASGPGGAVQGDPQLYGL